MTDRIIWVYGEPKPEDDATIIWVYGKPYNPLITAPSGVVATGAPSQLKKILTAIGVI